VKTYSDLQLKVVSYPGHLGLGIRLNKKGDGDSKPDILQTLDYVANWQTGTMATNTDY